MNEKYNYAASANGGRLQFFYAKDKDGVNKAINEIAEANNTQDIQLYRVILEPVPLKKTVTLTI